MGAAHGHSLHYHGHSVLHRTPVHAKIVGLLAFVSVVVLTPGTYLLAFAAYAVIVAALIAVSEVPVRSVLGRLWPVVPFIGVALLLPLVATGERVDVGPVSLAVEGLRGGLTLLLKVLLASTSAVLFAATTLPRAPVRSFVFRKTSPPVSRASAFGPFSRSRRSTIEAK